MPNWFIHWRYVRWGLAWGEATSYWHMGPCVGWDKIQRKYAAYKSEAERRGLKTWSDDAFVMVGGGYMHTLDIAEEYLQEND